MKGGSGILSEETEHKSGELTNMAPDAYNLIAPSIAAPNYNIQITKSVKTVGVDGTVKVTQTSQERQKNVIE